MIPSLQRNGAKRRADERQNYRPIRHRDQVMQNVGESDPRLSDCQRTRAAAAHLVAMAMQRFPPDLVELSPWLDPFLEPDFDPQMRKAALRCYALLSWQFDVHCSVYGPH